MIDFSSILNSLPAIGGIADTFFGDDDSEAAGKSYKLAKKQFELMRQLALAGYDNGRGMKVRFDPKTGNWVTELSGISGQLQDASNQNELNRLTRDEPRIAQERYQNSMQRSSMRPIIDTLIAKLANTSDITPEALEGDLNYLSGRALDDVYGQVQNDIATTALRSPGSFMLKSGPQANLVKQLGQQKQDAMVENRLKALTGADSINNQRRSNLINQTNSLSANAFNYDDVPFAPSTLSTEGTSIAQNNRAQAPGYLGTGLEGVLGAAQLQQPSNKYGDLATGLSSILSAFKSNSSPTSTTVGNKSTAAKTPWLQNYNRDRAY